MRDLGFIKFRENYLNEFEKDFPELLDHIEEKIKNKRECELIIKSVNDDKVNIDNFILSFEDNKRFIDYMNTNPYINYSYEYTDSSRCRKAILTIFYSKRKIL